MADRNIEGIMNITMENLKALVDADTIIGTPVVVGDTTLIPVSKVAFGLATGGSDFPSKSGTGLFGGGGGAGVTITPVAFISVTDGVVKMMPIYNELSTVDKALTMAPELIDKIKELFKKDKKQIAE
jgi:sporulation protein YtfJ